MENNLVLAVPLIFIVAALYSSVGHGGASGYLAAFSLLGIALKPLLPMVLVLNIIVASISFLHFRKPANFRFSKLLPFIITSIPAAYIGGMWKISNSTFSIILGLALLAGGLRIIGIAPKATPRRIEGVALWRIALPIGLILGLVSGMIGIGGGIFLSPILIYLGLTDTRESAAMSSAFIVLNSLSGLLGHTEPLAISSEAFFALIGAGMAGGFIGSNWGAMRAKTRGLQYALGAVLVIASVKLLISAI